MENEHITAIVLAGRRLNETSKKNEFGAFTKINNKYAIEYVLNTLKSTNKINRINLVANKNKKNMILNTIETNQNVKFIEPESGPSLSAKKALNGLSKPCLLTTGDHPLLTAKAVNLFLKKSITENADMTIGLVPHRLLIENNIASNRTLYKFRDGNFCCANLFLFKTDQTNHIFNMWNKVETSRKHPWKVISFFGLSYLVLYLLGVMKFESAEKYLSKKTRLRIKFIKVTCFKAAIDLDSEKDYPLIKELLGEP